MRFILVSFISKNSYRPLSIESNETNMNRMNGTLQTGRTFYYLTTSHNFSFFLPLSLPRTVDRFLSAAHTHIFTNVTKTLLTLRHNKKKSIVYIIAVIGSNCNCKKQKIEKQNKKKFIANIFFFHKKFQTYNNNNNHKYIYWLTVSRAKR